MANTKKSQFTQWLTDTATLRASLRPLDRHEQALYIFLRSVEKQAARVKADGDGG